MLETIVFWGILSLMILGILVFFFNTIIGILGFALEILFGIFICIEWVGTGLIRFFTTVKNLFR